jgi:hypothetical protein
VNPERVRVAIGDSLEMNSSKEVAVLALNLNRRLDLQEQFWASIEVACGAMSV